MPLYEYACSDCGSEFEKLVSFSDTNINSPDCPECSSKNTNKRLSVIASLGSSSNQNASSASCGSSGGFS